MIITQDVSRLYLGQISELGSKTKNCQLSQFGAVLGLSKPRLSAACAI
ncbi:hypothetical protein NIES4071_40310 [Calothrix sp. NIES-4071]|nr:hypothetical protein NIES4071_40310 [Calothrix sp. NIES-4071]BAZ58349.1 hypothetical protein NIES4105_40250 [Calothrix sp. NIES-4105]